MLYVVTYTCNRIEKLSVADSGVDSKSNRITAFSKDGVEKSFSKEEVGSTIFFSRSEAVFNLKRYWGLVMGAYPFGIDTDMITDIIPKKYRELVISEDFFQNVFLAICEQGGSKVTFEDFKDIVKVCVDSVVREKASTETIIDASDEFVVEDPFESCKMFLPLYMEKALCTLTPLEQKILKLRFGLLDGESKTLEEVANILNEEGALGFKVGRERVRLWENKAIRRLRRTSVADMLRDFYR